MALQEDSKTVEEVEVQKLLEKYPPVREHLLEVFHDLQDHDPQHSLSDAAMAEVASHLGLTPSDVKGTASFYSMFRFTPRGRHLIRICAAPVCVAVEETTVEGAFTLETTSCLGLCSVTPTMMIDEEAYGDLAREGIEVVIGKIRREDEAS